MRKKTLFNIKGAGRLAIHDRGIRHIARDEFKTLSVFHLTIKIEKSKAGLKNKVTLKLLHTSIKKARLTGLRIIHFTLEYDHVHMLVEADSKSILGKGMQSFGISFSKGINRLKKLRGRVYKTRYHLRKLKTPTEVKIVIKYILGNVIKHKSSSFINTFNSLVVIDDFSKLYPGFESGIEKTIGRSEYLSRLKTYLITVVSSPKSYLVK